MAVVPAEPSAGERAEHHAQEAERLLKGRLGIITNIVKAQVHATLAVYYATRQGAPTLPSQTWPKASGRLATHGVA
jgi:hypothetical protein